MKIILDVEATRVKTGGTEGIKVIVVKNQKQWKLYEKFIKECIKMMKKGLEIKWDENFVEINLIEKN